jgi:hypothetical protein
MPIQIAPKRMPLPARHIHVGWYARIVQLPQLTRQLGRVCKLDARLAAVGKKPLYAFVPKSFDHGISVSNIDTLCNLKAAGIYSHQQ